MHSPTPKFGLYYTLSILILEVLFELSLSSCFASVSLNLLLPTCFELLLYVVIFVIYSAATTVADIFNFYQNWLINDESLED